MKPRFISLLLAVCFFTPALEGEEPATLGPSAEDGFSLLTQASHAIDAYDLAEAERLARLGVEQTIIENGDEHPAVASALTALGRALFRQERFEEAVPHFARALAIVDRAMGKTSPAASLLAEMVMECWHRDGRAAESLAAADDALSRFREQNGADEIRLLTAHRRRGESLIALGRVEEAEASLTEALGRSHRLFGESHPGTSEVQGRLEECRRRRGEAVVPLYVGPFGSPHRLIFEGNETIPQGELQKSVFTHPPVFAASHPAAPMALYLKQLETAVSEGYRHAGFPNPEVTVEIDATANVIRLRLVEGRRYQCGKVIIRGATGIDVDELTANLTTTRASAVSEKAFERLESSMAGNLSKLGTGALGSGESLPTFVDPLVKAEISAGPGSKPPPTDDQAAVAEQIATLQKQQLPFSGTLDPVWMTGGPARFSRGAADGLHGRVRAHFFEIGRAQTEFACQTEVNETTGTVDLIIEIQDQGPASVLGTVTVTGATKNSADQIAGLAGLVSGSPMKRQTLRDATKALWQSGRFRDFKVSAQNRSPKAPEIDVSLTVVELETAPPLAEPLAPELQALVKCAAFLSSPDQWNGDLVVEWKPKAEKPRNGGTRKGVTSTVVQAAYSSGGDIVLSAASPGPPRQGFLLTLHDRSIDLVSSSPEPHLALRTSLPKTGGGMIHFGMIPGLTPGSESSLQFGAGFSSAMEEASLRLEIAVPPAFFLEKGLRSKLRTSRRRGQMTLVSDTLGRLRLDQASGRLIEWVSHDTEANTLTWRIQPNVVQKLVAETATIRKKIPESGEIEMSLLTAAGLGMWALFQSDLLDAERGVGTPPPKEGPGGGLEWLKASDSKAMPVAMRLIRAIDPVLVRVQAAILGAVGTTGTNPGSAPSFSIPVDLAAVAKGGSMLSWVGPSVFALADEYTPPDSWLWTFAREVAYITSGQTQTSETVFTDLLADPSIGPVGCLVAAQVLQRLKHPAATGFLRRATSLTRAADFRRDWKLLTDREWIGREILQAALDELERLDQKDWEALAQVLPDDWFKWLKGTAAGLTKSAGRPLADRLEPHFDSLWESVLATRVRDSALRGLGPVVPKVDPSTVAASVNADVITRQEVAAVRRMGDFFPHLRSQGLTDGGSGVSADDQTVEQLILARLARQFLVDKKIPVDESYVDEFYQKQVGASGSGSEQTFLERVGLTRSELLDLMRLNFASTVVVQQVAATVAAPTEAAVEAAKPDWARRQGRRYHLHMLALPPGAPLEKRLAWADALYDLVATDVPFESLVQAASGSLGGAHLLGACLGEDAARTFTNPWLDAVQALQPGGTTPPGIAPNGAVMMFHLVGTDESTGAGTTPSPEDVRAGLEKDAKQAAVRRFFAQARGRATIRHYKPPPAAGDASPTTLALAEFADRTLFAPGAYQALLWSRLRDGATAEATEVWNRLESIDMNEEAWKQLSAGLLDRGHADLAEKAARAALRHDPDSASSHLRLGQALAGQKNLREAEITLRRSLELRQDPETHQAMGLVLEATGRLDEAVAEWRDATAMAPEKTDFWSALSRGLEALGRRDEAKAAAKMAASTAKPEVVSPSLPTLAVASTKPGAAARMTQLADLMGLEDELRPGSTSTRKATEPLPPQPPVAPTPPPGP
ncbi:MAG: tetratricopeptide repeat protein [Verrucomicrobiales bacterium]